MKVLRNAGNNCESNEAKYCISCENVCNSHVEPRVERGKLRMFDAGSADQSALAAFSEFAGIFKFPSNSFRLFRTLVSSHN